MKKTAAKKFFRRGFYHKILTILKFSLKKHLIFIKNVVIYIIRHIILIFKEKKWQKEKNG